MILGSIFIDFEVPVGHFSITFWPWGYLARVWGSRGRSWSQTSIEKVFFGGPFCHVFQILWGLFFKAIFGRLPEQFFNDFGVGWGPRLGSFSRPLQWCCKSSKIQPCCSESTVFYVQKGQFSMIFLYIFQDNFQNIFLLIFLVLGGPLRLHFRTFLQHFLKQKSSFQKKRFRRTDALAKYPPRGASLTPLSLS